MKTRLSDPMSGLFAVRRDALLEAAPKLSNVGYKILLDLVASSPRALTVAEVGSWAIHPGGPKILEAVQDALALPASALETSKHIFANYGNMSSPTVLFILNAMRTANAPRPCVMLGFGPGLMAEAVLMR